MVGVARRADPEHHRPALVLAFENEMAVDRLDGRVSNDCVLADQTDGRVTRPPERPIHHVFSRRKHDQRVITPGRFQGLVHRLFAGRIGAVVVDEIYDVVEPVFGRGRVNRRDGISPVREIPAPRCCFCWVATPPVPSPIPMSPASEATPQRIPIEAVFWRKSRRERERGIGHGSWF